MNFEAVCVKLILEGGSGVGMGTYFCEGGGGGEKIPGGGRSQIFGWGWFMIDGRDEGLEEARVKIDGAWREDGLGVESLGSGFVCMGLMGSGGKGTGGVVNG